MISTFFLVACFLLVLLGTVVFFIKQPPGFLIAMLGVLLYFVVLLAKRL
jgi:hypothetical protein